MRRADALLLDMLEAARSVMSVVGGRDRRAFEADRVSFDAVMWNLSIIGEAASRVPEAIRQETPAIPWRTITAMRNRLVHGYFAIDRERVWKVVAEDISPLIAALEPIVGRYRG